MSASDQTETATKRPWHRFTIAGFLIFVLGISAGLARAREKGMVWPDPFFATFAVWFIVGMVQAAHRGLRSPSFLSVAGPVFAILLLGLSALLYLDRKLHWWQPAELDIVPDLAASSAVSFLFYVGVICGYTDALVPPSRIAERPAALKWLIAGATWLLAGIWLAIVLWNTGIIVALVHAAIHGIRLNQPYRRMGVEIYPFPYSEYLTQQFLIGAVVAATLAVVAGALVLTLNQARHQSVLIRLVLVVAWFTVVLVNAILLGWFYCVLLPEWSPIVRPFLFSEPSSNGLATLLLLATSGLFAARTATEFHPAAPSAMELALKSPLFHRRKAVMVLFLAVIIWSTVNSPTYGWAPVVRDLQSALEWVKYTAQMHLTETDLIVKVAAFVCVFIALRRNWRSTNANSVVATVAPSRFFVAWGLWFFTGLVAIPALAWFSVFLAFW